MEEGIKTYYAISTHYFQASVKLHLIEIFTLDVGRSLMVSLHPDLPNPICQPIMSQSLMFLLSSVKKYKNDLEK